MTDRLSPEEAVEALREAGVDFYAGVPGTALAPFVGCLADNALDGGHVITANEGSAVALVTGHYLATSRLGVVYMDNSGLGNAVNPLISLVDSSVYGIPMLLMIGWRGGGGGTDAPQHIKQGRITTALLETLGIPYSILSTDREQAGNQIRSAVTAARSAAGPHALLVQPGTFESQRLSADHQLPYGMSREHAIAMLLDRLDEDQAVVATTGRASRELFELISPEQRRMSFLTVGSMGHASQIALGIALARPSVPVYCLDGDGAALMHLGSLATIGLLQPDNLRHLVLNNGAHESVGGQPTGGYDIDFAGMARAAGYRWSGRTDSAAEFEPALTELIEHRGPSLLDVRINRESRPDLGRPTVPLHDLRDAFMGHLQQ